MGSLNSLNGMLTTWMQLSFKLARFLGTKQALRFLHGISTVHIYSIFAFSILYSVNQMYKARKALMQLFNSAVLIAIRWLSFWQLSAVGVCAFRWHLSEWNEQLPTYLTNSIPSTFMSSQIFFLPLLSTLIHAIVISLFLFILFFKLFLLWKKIFKRE